MYVTRISIQNSWKLRHCYVARSHPTVKTRFLRIAGAAFYTARLLSGIIRIDTIVSLFRNSNIRCFPFEIRQRWPSRWNRSTRAFPRNRRATNFSYRRHDCPGFRVASLEALPDLLSREYILFERMLRSHGVSHVFGEPHFTSRSRPCESKFEFSNERDI